ncbi:hypothetical protein PsorP6_010982 [Peronosclerospora sorghi]|uniref:Uncharacterized protein n=1 Tax=Peronosclerospora sorghi TaxID=230839 RepID=A0ACC0VVS2_9STRA|nr:hypothetical protein PsorP6_010982 [Peronosclerospora sorghi]
MINGLSCRNGELVHSSTRDLPRSRFSLAIMLYRTGARVSVSRRPISNFLVTRYYLSPALSQQMPHLEDFFTHGSSSCSASRRRHPGPDSDRLDHHAILYVHGPRDAGQTSLLLQFGFTYASAGTHVLLLLPRALDASPSLSPARNDLVPLTPCAHCHEPVQTGEANRIWNRIKIKHVHTYTEVQRFLTSFHVEETTTPSVLLITDLETLFTDPSSMHAVYQTLALLREYMEHTSGTGLVVVTGHTDASVLEDRRSLRRWCRFLELVALDERHTFLLRQDVGPREDEPGSGAPQQHEAAVAHVKYTFIPSSEDTSGTFQFLDVARL